MIDWRIITLSTNTKTQNTHHIMKNLLKTLTLFLVAVFPATEASAQFKDGEATVVQGSSTTVSIGTAYQTTLNYYASSVNYTWSTSSSAITIQSKTKTSCTIKSNTVGTTKLNYHCSYYIDGYYRTMDFYYDITITSSTVSVYNITVSPNAATLDVGETVKITATIYPSNATNKKVNWDSLNPNVATVDNNGNITAIAPGSTSILAASAENYVYQDWVRITVNAPAKVSSIELSETKKTLNIGDKFTLSASVLPDNAANKNVSWATDNSKIATVANGHITAVGPGNCNIICSAADGSGVSATCAVTVNEPEHYWLSVKLPNGSFAVDVTDLDEVKIRLTADEGYSIHSLTLNGIEQTISGNDSYFTLPKLETNTTLNAVFTSISTNINEVGSDANSLHVSVSGSQVTISGATDDTTAYVYNTNGSLVKTTTEYCFDLNVPGVYILRIGNRSFKFAI